jgi:hypothetical protein
MKSLIAVMVLPALVGCCPNLCVGAGREDQDMMMFLQNFEDPS